MNDLALSGAPRGAEAFLHRYDGLRADLPGDPALRARAAAILRDRLARATMVWWSSASVSVFMAAICALLSPFARDEDPMNSDVFRYRVARS